MPKSKKTRQAYKDPIKILLDRVTPYVKVISFFGVLLFTSGGLFYKFNANAETLDKHEVRIGAVENNTLQINQKLDDMMFFFHVPRRGR